VKRRTFITLLGGAVAWPLAARAQQPGQLRRLGVLIGVSGADGQARAAAFVQGLRAGGFVRQSAGSPGLAFPRADAA
jgi:putative tryptophan/tyrosine transport system substrate-binding protein